MKKHNDHIDQKDKRNDQLRIPNETRNDQSNSFRRVDRISDRSSPFVVDTGPDLVDVRIKESDEKPTKGMNKSYDVAIQINKDTDITVLRENYLFSSANAWVTHTKKYFESVYTKGNRVAELQKENEELREALNDL